MVAAQPVGSHSRKMTLMMTCALITLRARIMVKVLHLKLGLAHMG